MAARPAARSDLQIKSQPASSAWVQQFLLFALFFAGLMLLHAPLLRLPYFWDEAGYYIPAARDLFLTGTLIPQSTPSNAHPPLVLAWLALAWRVFGYSTLVTRTASMAVRVTSVEYPKTRQASASQAITSGGCAFDGVDCGMSVPVRNKSRAAGM